MTRAEIVCCLSDGLLPMSIIGSAPQRNGNEDDHTGLLLLAASGLAVGALAGVVASAVHFALDAAGRPLAALLAGAIFVFEELVRRFELRVAVATLSACSAGLVIMRMLIGDRLVFSVPAIVVEVFPGYLVFLVFGGVVGVLGVLYSRMVVAGLDLADGLRRVPPQIQAA